MSASLWCDINDAETNAPHQIGHSFSANDKNRRHFAQTQMVEVQTGNSYGRATFQSHEEVTDELDMCGYHWSKQNPFQGPKELSSAEEQAQKTRTMEVENDEWERGYEAGIDHALRPKRTL